jgi:protein-S-isoprenylcysteine O-methyltransferase Ste14
MFNSIFKIIYLIEFLIASIVRKIYTSRNNKPDLKIQRKSNIEQTFLILSGIGMIVPIVYVFSSVLDFADYSLPNWLGWTGIAFFAFAIWLLWRSHYDLGRNWTVIVALQHEHELITGGVYKYIRHPMYTAHLVWAIAQILILHNWIAGYSFLIFQIPFYFLRIRNEEKMMLEQFGDAYKTYMNNTDRLIPKII